MVLGVYLHVCDVENKVYLMCLISELNHFGEGWAGM